MGSPAHGSYYLLAIDPRAIGKYSRMISSGRTTIEEASI
jgi:hypothetical protein